MRPHQTEQADNPPKDIYQLFLEKEVRRAWGDSPKEQAEIILDYYQAMLQAHGVHQPCNQCATKIKVEQIQHKAQMLLQQLQVRKQQIQNQRGPTRQDWRTLFQACIRLSDEFTLHCTSCEPILLRTIIAQFYQIRKEQRKGDTA